MPSTELETQPKQPVLSWKQHVLVWAVDDSELLMHVICVCVCVLAAPWLFAAYCGLRVHSALRCHPEEVHLRKARLALARVSSERNRLVVHVWSRVHDCLFAWRGLSSRVQRQRHKSVEFPDGGHLVAHLRHCGRLDHLLPAHHMGQYGRVADVGCGLLAFSGEQFGVNFRLMMDSCCLSGDLFFLHVSSEKFYLFLTLLNSLIWVGFITTSLSFCFLLKNLLCSPVFLSPCISISHGIRLPQLEFCEALQGHAIQPFPLSPCNFLPLSLP